MLHLDHQLVHIGPARGQALHREAQPQDAREIGWAFARGLRKDEVIAVEVSAEPSARNRVVTRTADANSKQTYPETKR